jgi:hypothetical protein
LTQGAKADSSQPQQFDNSHRRLVSDVPLYELIS